MHGDWWERKGPEMDVINAQATAQSVKSDSVIQD